MMYIKWQTQVKLMLHETSFGFKKWESFEMFYFSVYEKGNKRIRVFAFYHKMNLICDSQMLFKNTQNVALMRCYYNTSRWGYNIANYLNMESPIRIIVRVCVEKLQTIIYMKYMGRTCIFHTKYRERNWFA